jgi:type III restriction enzyme
MGGKRAALRHRQGDFSVSLPPQLQTALEALYGHYEKTY